MKTLELISFAAALILSQSRSFAAESTNSFPPDFQWCAATAAHQIEGQNFNSDWWVWEQQGHTKKGAQSGKACDSWNRYGEDIELLKKLGVKRYRLSVEWAKIEPVPGHINQDAIKHYKDEMIALRKAGIAPLVTLSHYTLPLWFSDLGGWESDGAPAVFARYVTAVRDALEDEVHDWVTINEPTIFLSFGYLEGTHPPGKKSPKALGKALEHVLKAHALAYHILHDGKTARAGQKIRVGMAHALVVLDPLHSWNPIDRWLNYYVDQEFNWAIPESLKTGVLKFHIPFFVSFNETIPGLKGTEDFFGINYYTRNHVGITFTGPHWINFSGSPPLEAKQKSDLGWEIYPEGLYRLLKKIHELDPELPIIITENGIADADDSKRIDYITTHLEQVQRALHDQIPVEGYCYWSLLDNFEWNEGFVPRFGLYQMDYATEKRTARPSALFFGELTRKNAIPSKADLKSQ